MSSSTTSSGIAARAACGRPPSRRPTCPAAVAAAEPLVERGVHRHVEVGGDGEPAARRGRPRCSRSGSTKIRADDLLVGAAGGVVHDLGHRRHVVGRQPVDDRAVGLAAGEPQHALAQRGDEDRRRLLGTHAEAEPLTSNVSYSWRPSRRRARRAGSARCRGPSCTAPRTGRRSTARRSRCCDDPMPMAKRPGRGVGQRGDALRQAGRAPRVGGHDGGAEAQPRLPRRGQRQRREGVGAVGLGRPDVGVAEVGQLGERSRWVCSGPGSGTVMPGRTGSVIAGAWSIDSGAIVAIAARPASRSRPSAIAGVACPRSGRCSSGWPWPAACRPRRTCAPARDRSRARRRGRGCRAAPTRSARAARPAACCRGCCRRRGSRAPGRRPSARSRRARRARRRRRRRARSGMRAHSSVRPSPGVPSSSSKSRPLASRWSSRSLIVSVVSQRCGRRGQSSGGGTSAASSPTGPRRRTRAAPRAALTVRISRSPTWPDRAGLGDLVALDGERHVDVDDLAGPGEREVLRRRPHAPRPVVPSIAAIAAPSPHPPNRNPPPVQTPAVTGTTTGTGCGSVPGRGRCGCPCRRQRTTPDSRHADDWLRTDDSLRLRLQPVGAVLRGHLGRPGPHLGRRRRAVDHGAPRLGLPKLTAATYCGATGAPVFPCAC